MQKTRHRTLSFRLDSLQKRLLACISLSLVVIAMASFNAPARRLGEQLPFEIDNSGQYPIEYRSDITGYGRHYPTRSQGCKQIRGWVTNNTFATNITNVSFFDNGVYIGSAKADKYWDQTVGNHGFKFDYQFPQGEHEVIALAQNPQTGKYIQLKDMPLTFSCPVNDYKSPGETDTLQQDSCIENPHQKLCFDDVWGGTISALYNKQAPDTNLILPEPGGAFQVALRSTDPITPCNDRQYAWGQVWNPTQAGCPLCFTYKGHNYHVPSQVTSRLATNTYYQITTRIRNFYHHDIGDCRPDTPYIASDAQAEDIYVTETAEALGDYMKVNWQIRHAGNQTHFTDPSKKYRHELPTIYINKMPDCFQLTYENQDGRLVTIPFICKDDVKNVDFVKFRNSWFSIQNPKNPEEKATFITNTSIVDNSEVESIMRRYYDGYNGNQFDFSQYFSITPKLTFTTTTYILPYSYNETMESGQAVLNFIKTVQASSVTGWARHYPAESSWCKQIRGWASDNSFSTNVNSVKIFDNGSLIGDVMADEFWDSTVGKHGFVFDHQFARGYHQVVVLAQDPITRNHTTLNSNASAPLEFNCN